MPRFYETSFGDETSSINTILEISSDHNVVNVQINPHSSFIVEDSEFRIFFLPPPIGLISAHQFSTGGSAWNKFKNTIGFVFVPITIPQTHKNPPKSPLNGQTIPY